MPYGRRTTVASRPVGSPLGSSPSGGEPVDRDRGGYCSEGAILDSRYTVHRPFLVVRRRTWPSMRDLPIALTQLLAGDLYCCQRAHRHHNGPREAGSWLGRCRTAAPCGCQNSAMGSDQRFQAAASYSLIRPPRIGRRRILPRTGSGTGDVGRGGRNCSARCGRRRVVVGGVLRQAPGAGAARRRSASGR